MAAGTLSSATFPLKSPDKTDLGILGVNGSGKSTLLRILGGIDYPGLNKDPNTLYVLLAARPQRRLHPPHQRTREL